MELQSSLTRLQHYAILNHNHQTARNVERAECVWHLEDAVARIWFTMQSVN